MKTIFNNLPAWPTFLLLFGLFFFTIGSGMTYQQKVMERQGVEAPGVVVGLYESDDSDGSTYAPVVQFRTTSGQSVEFVTSYYSSPPAYDVGQSVIVVYPPEEPGNAVIKGDGQLFHIIFMLAGGTVAAVGSYLMYVSLRDMVFASPEE